MRISPSPSTRATSTTLILLLPLLPLLPLALSAHTPLDPLGSLSAPSSPSILPFSPSPATVNTNEQDIPNVNTPTMTTTTTTPHTRGDAHMYDGLIRPHLPKDKSGVPAFLAHLHAVEMGHSMGGLMSLGSGAGQRRDWVATAQQAGEGIAKGDHNGKTGVEGDNVGVIYEKQDGTTVGVHDLDIQQPAVGRVRRRTEAKRSEAARWARQVLELDVDEEAREGQVPDEGAADGHRQAGGGGTAGKVVHDLNKEGKEGQTGVESVYRPRQATRAQVIARHKWKMRNNSGAALQPAHSGDLPLQGQGSHDAYSSIRAPLTCADYTQYDLRLTQAGSDKAFVVSSSERDASAHLSSSDGSVFKLYDDCELCVPQAGTSGRGLCANISPSRSRAVVYFDTNANIAMYNYNQATCSIGGGGASGPLTCTIPRSPGVTTFCILGDDTLVIRNGACDPSAGEGDVKVIATVR